MFGAWDLPLDACERPDWVGLGYQAGVAMGGVLPERPVGDSAPSFLAAGLRDPGTPDLPGGLLQRLQIIKVWLGEDGRFHQSVHELAGNPRNGADVDLASCQPRGPGDDLLCSVWRDPDFDPSRDAAYYVRLIENPSCRWSWYECLALDPAERPATCSDPAIPRTIQERAWSSPIWYSP